MYSTKGNTVGNAIPGVFFYYADYTPKASDIKSGKVTIVVTQTWTPSTILAPFNARNENNIRVADNKCNSIALSSVAYDKLGGVATLTFNATAGKKYIISVKYDTKSLIGSKLPSGKPLSGVMATYTFGMTVGGTAVPGTSGSIDAKVGCSDNTPAPTGTCPTTILAKPITEATEQVEIPAELSVSAAPNPFTNVVKFTIQSPVSGNGSLDMYNLMGQKLYNVYSGHITAGVKQTVEFNAPSKNSGNLIYSLKVGGRQVNGKLIQIK